MKNSDSPYDLFDGKTLDEAMHYCYSNAFASWLEQEKGVTFGGSDIFYDTPRCPEPGDAQLRMIAVYWLGMYRKAWLYPVRTIFHHAGIEEAGNSGDALGYLFFGCMGNGIGIEDKYKEEMEKAAKVLLGSGQRKIIEFNSRAVSLDDSPVHEIAGWAAKRYYRKHKKELRHSR